MERKRGWGVNGTMNIKHFRGSFGTSFHFPDHISVRCAGFSPSVEA
ncbi:MAG TPA: hypothetical protein VGC95_13405 [Chitinophagaceae bacterium]